VLTAQKAFSGQIREVVQEELASRDGKLVNELKGLAPKVLDHDGRMLWPVGLN